MSNSSPLPRSDDGVELPMTDAQWRERLTAQQYYVTREKGTERPFTGEYWDCKQDGVYHCICCGAPLFDSKTKYESRTGWPSFFQPIAEDHVATVADNTLFEQRVEVTCRRCDAHLGHVFTDGPPPTGLRYCLNSASLSLVEEPAGSDSLSPDAP